MEDNVTYTSLTVQSFMFTSLLFFCFRFFFCFFLFHEKKTKKKTVYKNTKIKVHALRKFLLYDLALGIHTDYM